MSEPGLDLHEWRSRWASVAEVREDDPAGALSLLAEIVEDMVRETGYGADDPVAAEGAEPEIVRTYRAAREVAERAEVGEASRAEIEDAMANLDEVYGTIVAERPEA